MEKKIVHFMAFQEEVASLLHHNTYKMQSSDRKVKFWHWDEGRLFTFKGYSPQFKNA